MDAPLLHTKFYIPQANPMPLSHRLLCDAVTGRSDDQAMLEQLA